MDEARRAQIRRERTFRLVTSRRRRLDIEMAERLRQQFAQRVAELNQGFRAKKPSYHTNFYSLVSSSYIANSLANLGRKPEKFWLQLDEAIQAGAFDIGGSLCLYANDGRTIGQRRPPSITASVRASLLIENEVVSPWIREEAQRGWQGRLRETYASVATWRRWLLQQDLPLPRFIKRVTARHKKARPLIEQMFRATEPNKLSRTSHDQAVEMLRQAERESEGCVNSRSAQTIIENRGGNVTKSKAQIAAKVITGGARGRRRKCPEKCPAE